MPVRLIEHGQEKLVSELAAFNRLSDDADLGNITSRLLRGERIHTMNRDGAPIQLQLIRSWHKDELFDREDRRQPELLASKTVPPLGNRWVGDCTLLLELDCTVHCNALDEKSALSMIEDTILGRLEARPDFTIKIDNGSLEALYNRIDHMRLPTDLGASQVITHKLTKQALLEDQT
jgi:hypothetical protein